jgi:transposase
LGFSLRKIAYLTNIPKSTVHRWLQTNQPCRQAQRRKAHLKKWGQHVHAVLERALQNNPYVTYTDLKQCLANECAASVVPSSTSTIHTWLRKRMKVSRKRASGKYSVDNESVQARVLGFKEAMKDVPFDDVLAIDETSVFFTEHSRYG